jgi:DNA invertase Pin-like site-specific DNA recombinase
VAKIYEDHGISGAKGRNGRPAFDALCRDATKRQFHVVMAWNVDRLSRSLTPRYRSFVESSATVQHRKPRKPTP